VCGIVGFTHLEKRVDPSRIRRAVRSLVHRGPDQQGVYESDVVSLGAVRLKIIDLEHGQQPMSGDDGTTIVFNGEIYNHADVRQQLESLGHRFHSRCDTEVVLRAFVEWDVHCFRRLRGMFGVALWNEPRRRLILARDRVGIKPVYFAIRGKDLYFASELKGILEHPEIERRLSADGLHHYLSLNYVPCPYTLIEGLEKLRPGHWLEWRDGAVTSEPYWQLELKPDSRITVASAKEELDGLLRSAVKEHLVSDVPLGLWASGGLDSSAILHYAREACSSRIQTFSVSFRGRTFDETPYFRRIAQIYDTDHHEFDLTPDDTLPGVVEQLSYYSDEPSADAGAVPVWYLSQMTRRHVTVALSGEGADELFGGYVTYLADRYARSLRRVPRSARRLAARLSRFLPVSDEKIGLEYKLNRFLRGALLSPTEAHLYWNGTFSEIEKNRLHLQNGHMATGRMLEAGLNDPPAGYLNRYLWLDQSYYLPDDILYKCDRMSMAHSLEVRPPFLDHRIVEFAGRLPESFKVRGRQLKFLLRELMRDKLPAETIARKKEGFDIPAHQWLRTVLRPLLLDNLNRRTVEASGLFHWPEIESLIRNHLERRANLGYHLWGLLVLFLWMRRWNVVPSQASQESEDAPISASATN
jgi:asparagine synthase (glutamine-hydrolysing)